MLLNIFICICLFLMLLVFFKILINKNTMERLQAINLFNTFTIILILLYCFKEHRSEFIDLAFIYAVISYGSIIAITKYININYSKESKNE